MASQDIGKKWESKFASTWKAQCPGNLIYRLPDQQSGYAGGGSSNPCDFICHYSPYVLMVECKAHAKASIPFTAIPQYERLLEYKGLKNVYPGVLIWFYEKDVVLWVSIEEMEKMVTDGEKSIGLRMIDEKKPYKKSYNIIMVRAKKLRTFMEADIHRLIEQIELFDTNFEDVRPITPPGYTGPNATKYYIQKYIDKFEKNKEDTDG